VGAVPVGGLGEFSDDALAGGGKFRSDHVCATSGNTLSCWGIGPRGELGLGSNVHGSPVPIPVVVP
jgi:hypothetical protein